MQRGWEICEAILRSPEPSKHDWSLLFLPTEFFIRFDQYLVLEATAATEAVS